MNDHGSERERGVAPTPGLTPDPGASDAGTPEIEALGVDAEVGDWEASDEAQFRAVEATLEAEGLREEVAGLRQALESHPVIDMARGLVMAAGRCSPDEAWQVLVEVSQHTNIKLRKVAQTLVDGVDQPSQDRPVQEALRASLENLERDREDRPGPEPS